LIIKYLNEIELREQADKSTNKMLDLWHQLCIKEIGKSVEVLVFNRRDSPDLMNCNGVVNTNGIIPWKGKASLALFLENTSCLNYKIVTHEVGHWILKLQGVKGVRNDEESGEAKFEGGTEMLLNNLCSHPALYKLQRNMGHEPQSEIDSRANHNIVLVSKIAETDNPLVQVKDALLFTDDLINCSENVRKGLQRIISKRYPKTEKIVNRILEIKGTKDLSIIENANMFPQEIITRLSLSGNWSVVDSVQFLKNFVIKLNSK
jgi:hypothetical protein